VAGCAPDLTEPATDVTAREHAYDDGHRYSWVTMHKLSVAAIDEAGAIHTWTQEGYTLPELPGEYTYARIDGRYDSLCGLDVSGVLVCNSEQDGARVVNPDGPAAVSWIVDVDGRARWVGDDGGVRWEVGTQQTPPEEVTEAGGAVQVVGLIGDTSTVFFGCLRFASGAVTCWGGEGQGGAGIVPGGRYLHITTDVGSTCVIEPDGRVECWGQVAIDNSCYPKTDWTPGGTFATVETDQRRCAIDRAGTLQCQEDYDEFCPGPDNAVAQVAPGMFQDCWADVDGRIECAYRVLDPVCEPLGCDYGHPYLLQELWPEAGGSGA
jgi:hypothetical protein